MNNYRGEKVELSFGKPVFDPQEPKQQVCSRRLVFENKSME